MFVCIGIKLAKGPNPTTRKAVAELEAGKGKNFTSVDALTADLNHFQTAPQWKVSRNTLSQLLERNEEALLGVTTTFRSLDRKVAILEGILRGQQDIPAGKTRSHEEVMARMAGRKARSQTPRPEP